MFFVCAVNITTRFLYSPLSLFFSSRPEHKFYEKQFTLQTNKLTHYNHGDMSSSMRQILVHQCTYTYASMYRYVYTSVHMHVYLLMHQCTEPCTNIHIRIYTVMYRYKYLCTCVQILIHSVCILICQCTKEICVHQCT